MSCEEEDPREERSSPGRWAVGVVVAASLVSYLLAAYASPRLIHGQISSDFLHGYHPGALSIRTGAGYRDPAGRPITHWPPGYSLFIAPWVERDPASSVKTLRHVSGLLAVMWVLLLAWLSARLINERLWFLAFPLAVFWPPLIALGNPGGSEMLYAVLVAASASLLVWLATPADRSSRSTALGALGSGLVLGLAALVKTLGLALAGAALVAAVAAFHHLPLRRRLSIAAGMLAGSMLVLLPWVATYHRATGRLGFTSAGVPSIRDGLSRFSSLEAGEEVARRSRSWDSASDIGPDLLAAAREHPLSMTRLVATKSIRPWYATDSGRFDDYLMPVQLPWMLAFMCLATLAATRWLQTSPRLLVLYLMIASTWAAAVVALSIFRYMAPVFPLVILGTLAHISAPGGGPASE